MKFFSVFAILLYSFNLMAAGFSVEYDSKAKKFLVKDGKKIHEVALKVPKDLNLDGNKIDTYFSGDLAIVYLPLSDGDGATTFVYALTKSGQKLWKFDLQSFNSAPPLIEDNFVYVGAIGRIAKLNKKNGKAAWDHKELYGNPSIQYGGIQPIKRKGEMIQFAGNLKVNDKTGKIEKVKK